MLIDIIGKNNMDYIMAQLTLFELPGESNVSENNMCVV